MKALAPLTLSSSLCFWLLSVSSICTLCFCNQNSNHAPCIATERLVLIQLKNNLIDHANRLSSWVGNDCCSWSGVVCNNITGNVQEIRLRGPDDTKDELEEASKQMLGGTISPSVTKLLQLTYFDLSSNDFGLIPIPDFIGSFQNLRYLNISKSQFSGEIPHQLGNLSTLRILDLHDDPLSVNLHSKGLKWLMDLKELQYLDVGGIDLAKASDWFQVISTLPSLLEIRFSSCGLIQLPSNPTTVSFTSLVVLDLSYNIFSDSLLPQWIFSLHNLVLLDLTNCFISGLNPGIRADFNSFPSLTTLSVSSNTFVNSSSLLNGLSSLSKLRLLDVSNCNISAPILGNLHNLSFTVHLDFSNNQIVEEIPKSLSNLCNLNTLDLQSNNFFGNVSELLERFCECESPKLKLLALRGNYVTGQLPEQLGRLKNLESIDLAYNQLTGTIPDSVGSLHLLKTLQMNINQLTGSIPDTIGGLSSLNFLDLSYNNLNGSFPESIGRLGELVFLTVHHNSLTGIVTENHFTNLTSLTTLWIGENKLTFKLNVKNWIPPFKLQVLRIGFCNLGPRFPLWIQSQTSLTELDLANTNISDLIPNWIWTTFSSVTYFNISHNNIQGMLGNVSFLTPGALLDLSYNSFHGLLPGHFNRPDLDLLDLSSNSLSGSLEEFLCSGIQEPRQLSVLNLANNNMSGVISDCWTNWESLVILNLEKNQFSGIIPSSIGNISSLLSLDIRQNKLSGNLPVSLLNSKSLIIIELAENELVGRIPTSIGRENTSLKLLSLRSNKLEGKIPDEICHLSSIQIMDLAHNDLSGNLPTCFTNLTVISGKEKSSPFILYDELFQNQVLGSASLVTKGRVSTYDNILYLVTTLDLSNNKFSGSIPDELVSLLGLRFLNLSKNNLTGQIPNSFSKTGMLESLDLSVNHLNGNIPSSLSSLTSLSFLDVSYNNLVGRIPTGPQLQTFNESSFIGNKLCGDPLPVCSPNTNDPRGTDDEHDESDGIDWILVIFTVLGLVIGFWIMIGPLIVSKRWRNAYYHFLEGIWIKLQNSILIIFPCFRRRKPGHEVFSSIEQVQQFDLSQYIYDDKLKGFHPESSSSEASSSTQKIPHSDNKKA
ncbi:putative leucine-rich repeat-containing, plant-type, leucine-rich repeat domain superfamily [Helianthus annuus]|nr:putative leucine-rich repeat-containing, plant-type, leucine-rich repeat domain superfamily [Helianthus annuus]